MVKIEHRGDTMAPSCPSNWLKEGSLLLRPTDTTRHRPSEAGGEGRMLRGWVEGAPTGAGEAGVDSDSDCWAADAAAFAAWFAAQR